MTRADLLLPAALLAFCAGAAVSSGAPRPPFPPPSEIRVPPEGASGDMFALALGARRLFADVWFVRLMQYYGTPELAEGEEEEGGQFAWLVPHKPGEEDHHAGENGEGRYPEFLPRAMHVMELDPHFAAAGLYSAGSLAFNMGRPAEAERLLDYAVKYDPAEWKYATLLAAIGYSKSSSPAEVARAINPLLAEKDCPVMLKQLAAFLNKKAGDYAAAAAIYADIAATSRDQAYVANARRELLKLSERPRIK